MISVINRHINKYINFLDSDNNYVYNEYLLFSLFSQYLDRNKDNICSTKRVKYYYVDNNHLQLLSNKLFIYNEFSRANVYTDIPPNKEEEYNDINCSTIVLVTEWNSLILQIHYLLDKQVLGVILTNNNYRINVPLKFTEIDINKIIGTIWQYLLNRSIIINETNLKQLHCLFDQLFSIAVIERM